MNTVSQILTMVRLVAARRGIAFVPASTRGLGIAGVEYLELSGLADARGGAAPALDEGLPQPGAVAGARPAGAMTGRPDRC
ncbi:MAG TPA: hypothetical protein VFE39_07325 [Pseudonocardia sp.]|nr:hypothetical protein [Pseudonocardia sp.]